VAYAIGRAVGPAVTRNRIRRRLRALLRARSTQLEPGLYLIGVRSAAAPPSFDELTFDLDRLLRRMRSPTADRSPAG
jgi:ribonuclease P protein component